MPQLDDDSGLDELFIFSITKDTHKLARTKGFSDFKRRATRIPSGAGAEWKRSAYECNPLS